MPQSDGSICSRNQQGYYLDNAESNKLVYCSTNNSCDISEYNDGYFINSQDNDVIKCNNSTCDLFIPGSSCENHNNEIILYNEKLYYCHNEEMKDIINSNYYLELSNIKASSIYPTISSGDDIILLNIDGFSITQYITESIYFCCFLLYFFFLKIIYNYLLFFILT